MNSSGNQKASLWAVGLMLFALFFGAGNLIFPAFLGQQAGENWFSAMLGFLLTGAGLPLLGVIAIGYSNSRDVQVLASRVTPLYGILFASALYLAIGPLFATPRTATVSFEIGVVPYISEENKKKLSSWMAYKTAVKAVDVSTAPDINWPAQPEV